MGSEVWGRVCGLERERPVRRVEREGMGGGGRGGVFHGVGGGVDAHFLFELVELPGGGLELILEDVELLHECFSILLVVLNCFLKRFELLLFL